MRTEAAMNCGGGSDLIVMSKSRQDDVEAAFAIAQLSERDPRSTASDNHGLTMTTSGNLPRFSHVRTAVMPYADSRVEKAAVKRKLDWLDDGRIWRGKQARLGEAQRVIDAERNTFRRHKHAPRTDDDGSELVGRFTRTCESGGTYDDNHYSARLSPNVPSLFTSSSDVGRMVEDSRLAAGALYLPGSLRNRFAPHPRSHSDALHHHHSVGATPASTLYLLPEDHVPVGRSSMRYEEKKFHGRRTFEDGGADELRGRSSSLVSAYYSLGQSAAAAAASQLFQHQVKPSARSNSTGSTNHSLLPLGPRHVDSSTLSKVRQGTFGVLSTLRRYCAQLRRHSEPTTDVKRSPADDDVETEIAMDLSVRRVPPRGSSGLYHRRSSRSAGSSPSVRHHDEVPRGHWQTDGLVKSSFSLPSSPYYSHWRHQDVDDETKSSNVLSDVLPDVVSDSRLPLKKRWLYQHQYHHSDCDEATESTRDDSNRCETSETSSSPSSSSTAVAESTDREVMNENNVEQQLSLRCSQSVFLHTDEDGDLPLHIAVARGTVAAVDSIISIMLSLGVSLDYCNKLQQTALHLAVLTDQAQMVERLLNAGASSDVVDLRGQTCLHTAVLLDTTTCLRLLLQHPHDINAISYDGVTALHLAVQRGNLAAVRCLLSARADVDATDEYGHTPLYHASVLQNDVAMTDLLRAYGAHHRNMTRGANSTESTVALQASGMQYVSSSKCSGDVLQLLQQPVIGHRHLPACCPTG